MLLMKQRLFVFEHVSCCRVFGTTTKKKQCAHEWASVFVFKPFHYCYKLLCASSTLHLDIAVILLIHKRTRITQLRASCSSFEKCRLFASLSAVHN